MSYCSAACRCRSRSRCSTSRLSTTSTRKPRSAGARSSTSPGRPCSTTRLPDRPRPSDPGGAAEGADNEVDDARQDADDHHEEDPVPELRAASSTVELDVLLTQAGCGGVREGH